MAEYCLECFKKDCTPEEANDRYVLSDWLELCEGCGQQKRVVIRIIKPNEHYYYNPFVLFEVIWEGIVKLVKLIVRKSAK